MTSRPARGVMKLGLLLPCILLPLLSVIHAQTPDRAVSRPAMQQMGPVGEQESKPSKAAPPVNSVVDPGVIPSRQQITPAGLQSIFESRVYGVSFGADGNSIYAAVLGQKGSVVYQIDLKSNRIMTASTTEVSAGMQGLTYDSTSRTPFLSGVDTTTNRVSETIDLQPFMKRVAGSSPESVALSPDHSRLYVACAGINAVAVIDLHAQRPRITGLNPTGWYPDDVTVSPNGRFIAVSTLLA